jgi:hypothetical protein
MARAWLNFHEVSACADLSAMHQFGARRLSSGFHRVRAKIWFIEKQ